MFIVDYLSNTRFCYSIEGVSVEIGRLKGYAVRYFDGKFSRGVRGILYLGFFDKVVLCWG